MRALGRSGAGGVAVAIAVAVAVAAAVAAPALAAPAAQDAELGARIYEERCAFCHGEAGDGNGEVADDLLPRPRDFTGAKYKFTTTTNETLASDADLIKIVEAGLPGTAMPAWRGTLSDREISAVVEHLKTFAAADFEDEFIQPEPVNAGRAPGASDSLIAEGSELFVGEAGQCFKCHGLDGRGDGESAAGMTDDWEQPIYPADLTKAWRYKGGSSMQDIYMRLSTGIVGSPMPSYMNALTDDQRWAIAAYVSSIARPLSESTVVAGHRLEGDVPTTPDDEAWSDVAEVLLPLAGQVVFPPRWQNPSVDAVGVRVAFNESQVAILLTWGDRFHDSEGSALPPPLPDATDTYVRPVADYVRSHPAYSDRIRLQFPEELPERSALPYFYGGSPNEPVTLWELGAAAPTEPTIFTQAGARSAPAPATGADEAVSAQMEWNAGEYRAVFVRPREPSGGGIPFPDGRPIPFAIQAFDGDAGETSWVGDDGVAHDLGSLSAWYSIILKPETPTTVYLWTLLALVAVAGGEWGLARALRRRS